MTQETEQIQTKLDRDTLMFGCLLVNRYLFTRMFWKSDLKMEPSPKQKRMMSDTSQKILACTARKVAKTVSLEAYIAQVAVLKEGEDIEENMIVTPRQKHLDPLLDRVVTKIQTEPFFKLLKPNSNRGDGKITFANKCIWYTRIEGDSPTGQNMVGLRAKHIVGDEMAFGLDGSHKARFQTALPDCRWILCGVPNGVRGTPFYKLDQTEEGKGWSRHHMTSFDNPILDNPTERARLERDYGGTNTQDYITQVKGEWGDEAMSSFPRIGVEDVPFAYIELTDTQVNAVVDGIFTWGNLERLLLPLEPLGKRSQVWIAGVDVGFSPDPTVISLLFREGDIWRLAARIKLMRVTGRRQALIIHACNRLLGMNIHKIAIDCIGYGANLKDAFLVDEDLVTKAWDYSTIVMNANFGGRVQVGEDDKGNKLSIPTKQYSTDKLKDALARGYMLA